MILCPHLVSVVCYPIKSYPDSFFCLLSYDLVRLLFLLSTILLNCTPVVSFVCYPIHCIPVVSSVCYSTYYIVLMYCSFFCLLSYNLVFL